MSSAICFNLNQSKILSSGNQLKLYCIDKLKAIQCTWNLELLSANFFTLVRNFLSIFVWERFNRQQLIKSSANVDICSRICRLHCEKSLYNHFLLFPEFSKRFLLRVVNSGLCGNGFISVFTTQYRILAHYHTIPHFNPLPHNSAF